MTDLVVFSGRAHPQLTQDICRHLRLPVGQAQVYEFSNENIFVKIEQNVRGKDVFVVQSFSSPVSTSILELLIMIDAFKRASAKRITAVIPYYAYGRTDKKDQPRVPITARLLADCITAAGANRVLTMDLHAGQIQGFFNIPVDELTAETILARYIFAKELDDFTVVATDTGFAKKARNFAERLNAPLAIVEKRRVGNHGKTESLGLIGSVAGRHAIIVDDEIDTAGTMIQAANLVGERARAMSTPAPCMACSRTTPSSASRTRSSRSWSSPTPYRCRRRSSCPSSRCSRSPSSSPGPSSASTRASPSRSCFADFCYLQAEPYPQRERACGVGACYCQGRLTLATTSRTQIETGHMRLFRCG